MPSKRELKPTHQCREGGTTYGYSQLPRDERIGKSHRYAWFEKKKGGSGTGKWTRVTRSEIPARLRNPQRRSGGTTPAPAPAADPNAPKKTWGQKISDFGSSAKKAITESKVYRYGKETIVGKSYRADGSSPTYKEIHKIGSKDRECGVKQEVFRRRIGANWCVCPAGTIASSEPVENREECEKTYGGKYVSGGLLTRTGKCLMCRGAGSGRAQHSVPSANRRAGGADRPSPRYLLIPS